MKHSLMPSSSGNLPGTWSITKKPLKLVILESPYAGDIEKNVNYARICMRDSMMRGEAPIASHLLYAENCILDDTAPKERELGILAGVAWYKVAEAAVVYCDLDVSDGMKRGIYEAFRHDVPVLYRWILEYK